MLQWSPGEKQQSVDRPLPQGPLISPGTGRKLRKKNSDKKEGLLPLTNELAEASQVSVPIPALIVFPFLFSPSKTLKY